MKLLRRKLTRNPTPKMTKFSRTRCRGSTDWGLFILNVAFLANFSLIEFGSSSPLGCVGFCGGLS